jgi:hypothetical protein
LMFLPLPVHIDDTARRKTCQNRAWPTNDLWPPWNAIEWKMIDHKMKTLPSGQSSLLASHNAVGDLDYAYWFIKRSRSQTPHLSVGIGHSFSKGRPGLFNISVNGQGGPTFQTTHIWGIHKLISASLHFSHGTGYRTSENGDSGGRSEWMKF